MQKQMGMGQNNKFNASQAFQQSRDKLKELKYKSAFDDIENRFIEKHKH